MTRNEDKDRPVYHLSVPIESCEKQECLRDEAKVKAMDRCRWRDVLKAPQGVKRIK